MKKCLVFLSVIMLFCASGCDYREIDRGYLVNAIAFSKEDGSAKIYIEALSCSSVVATSEERVILTGSGKNFALAFEMIENSLTQPLYFEQIGAAVFTKDTKDECITFLQNRADIQYGIYLVSTDNVNALFNAKTPSGILGYDVIGLIKTKGINCCRLYQVNRDDFCAPNINFADNKLILNDAGERE